jgi:hypothetical protein
VKGGDIVRWLPAYALRAENFPQWTGIVIQIKQRGSEMWAQTYWIVNDENYYTMDWTPTFQLKIISNS